MTEQTITRSGWLRWPAGRAYLAVVALSCSGAALIAACSSSTATSANKSPKPAAASASASMSGMPKAATCVHINSIRTSLTSLTHVKVSSTSASQLTTDLANIQTHLSALKGQDVGAFTPAAKELTAELDEIKKDAAGLSASPSKAATALNADLTSLKRKAGPMIVEMRMICHST